MTGPQFVKAIFFWLFMLFMFSVVGLLVFVMFGPFGGFVLAGCFIVPTTLYWAYCLAQVEN